jgi:hypothetical protein
MVLTVQNLKLCGNLEFSWYSCNIFEKEIETETEFNYLGVTLTKNGKFKLANQKNIEKATKTMYEVIRRKII